MGEAAFVQELQLGVARARARHLHPAPSSPPEREGHSFVLLRSPESADACLKSDMRSAVDGQVNFLLCAPPK